MREANKKRKHKNKKYGAHKRAHAHQLSERASFPILLWYPLWACTLCKCHASRASHTYRSLSQDHGAAASMLRSPVLPRTEIKKKKSNELAKRTYVHELRCDVIAPFPLAVVSFAAGLGGRPMPLPQASTSWHGQRRSSAKICARLTEVRVRPTSTLPEVRVRCSP